MSNGGLGGRESWTCEQSGGWEAGGGRRGSWTCEQMGMRGGRPRRGLSYLTPGEGGRTGAQGLLGWEMCIRGARSYGMCTDGRGVGCVKERTQMARDRVVAGCGAKLCFTGAA